MYIFNGSKEEKVMGEMFIRHWQWKYVRYCWSVPIMQACSCKIGKASDSAKKLLVSNKVPIFTEFPSSLLCLCSMKILTQCISSPSVGGILSSIRDGTHWWFECYIGHFFSLIQWFYGATNDNSKKEESQINAQHLQSWWSNILLCSPCLQQPCLKFTDEESLFSYKASISVFLLAASRLGRI